MLLWWEWLKQEYTGSSDLKEILNNFFDHLDRDLSLGRDLLRGIRPFVERTAPPRCPGLAPW